MGYTRLFFVFFLFFRLGIAPRKWWKNCRVEGTGRAKKTQEAELFTAFPFDKRTTVSITKPTPITVKVAMYPVFDIVLFFSHLNSKNYSIDDAINEQ